jgi:hypothetical protein
VVRTRAAAIPRAGAIVDNRRVSTRERVSVERRSSVVGGEKWTAFSDSGPEPAAQVVIKLVRALK